MKKLLLILTILTACAARVPEGYFKAGASRQEFMQNYVVCENGIRDNTPLAVGNGDAALIGLVLGRVMTRGKIERCMGAFGWEYGPTYEGYRP